MDDYWQKGWDFWKSSLEFQKDYWDKVLATAGTDKKGRAWEGLPPFTEAFDPANFWTKQWSDFMSRVMPQQLPGYGKGVGPDTYQKMFSSADTLLNFLGFWTGIYKDLWERVPGFKEGKWDEKKFNEVFSEWGSKYRELINQVFAPGLPQSLTWLSDVYKGMLSGTQSDMFSRFLEPWAEFTRDHALMMVDPTKWTTSEIVDAYEEWRETYEKTFGHALRAPGLGYYRESYEKMVSSLDAWVEFNMSLAEFYATIYEAGVEAMEKLQKKLADLMTEKESPGDLKELYEIWWKTNEETYIEIFRTDEFSKMLGQLVDRGMEFRKHYREFLEELWKDLPFPKRSEMDHLYKTIHQLKKDVRELKSEIEGLREER